MPDDQAAASSARRAYGVSLLLLAGGGALLLVAYGLTWATTDMPLIDGAAETMRSQQYSGRELVPAAAMSGWIALAAVAGVVATRSWGRRIVGLLAFVAGLAGAVGGIAFAVAPARFIDGVASSGQATVQLGFGWLLAVIAGLAVAGAAALTVARGRQWPTMGVRYERRPATARVTGQGNLSSRGSWLR